MLMKLIKNDLKDIYKLIKIFYIITIVFAGITRVMFLIDNSTIINIIAQICSGITISMMGSILINNIMRMWARFTINTYKDESYLTHTLPVSKDKLYLSKFLTAIITMFTSILVIALSLFIAYYSKDNMITLKNVLLPVATAYGSTIVKLLCIVLVVVFVEMVTMLQCGYTGIIIGHKFNNMKLGYSVLFGFAAYTSIQIFVLAGVFIVGLFNANIMNLFKSNIITSTETLKALMYLAMILYTICIAIYYFVNIKLFKKGVNVD